jgi:hypothetical protein
MPKIFEVEYFSGCPYQSNNNALKISYGTQALHLSSASCSTQQTTQRLLCKDALSYQNILTKSKEQKNKASQMNYIALQLKKCQDSRQLSV